MCAPTLRIVDHAMERYHLASVVERDDTPTLAPFYSLAEEPGLHEDVAIHVQVFGKFEVPVFSTVRA